MTFKLNSVIFKNIIVLFLFTYTIASLKSQTNNSSLSTSEFEKKIIQMKKHNALARIAIFHLVNETNQKDLDFLSGSIAEAIVKNMEESLYFEIPNREENQILANKVLNSSKNFRRSRLEDVCTIAEIEYAIYGNIKKDRNGNIKIFSGVYSKNNNKIIAKNKQIIQSNSRMFDDIDKLSATLVDSIVSYIASQSKREEKAKRELIIKNPQRDTLPDRTPEELIPKKFRLYAQVFGYAILGSLNAEYQFLPLLSVEAGAGYLSTKRLNYTSASVFFALRYYHFALHTGPYFIYSNGLTLAAQSSLGYEFDLGKSFFVEPAIAFLMSGEAIRPYLALNMGFKF